MTATPTPEDLNRYMDLVVAGEDPADAIAVIWGEAAPPKPQKKPDIMVTEFPDGVVIGWDHCAAANGGCGRSVRQCTCKGGPKELKVFQQWRDGDKQMPDYAAASRAAARQGVDTSNVVPAGEAGVVVATQPVTPANAVPCREGKHFADIDKADRNDDGTYTCHACQEAASGSVVSGG